MKRFNSFMYVMYFWFGFLILIIGFENQNEVKALESTVAFEIENAVPILESKLEIQNEESEIARRIEIENPESEIVMDYNETASEIEIENRVPFFELSDADREIAINILAGETWGECWEGKIAVAQCIMDQMIYNDCSISGIRKQFCGYDSKLKSKDPESYEECVRAISEVFDKGNSVTYDFPLYFYNPARGNSKWHESMKYVGTWGHHKFFTIWE